MNFKITNLGTDRLNELMGGDIFPLQTIQSMAERWGVSKQTVNNWAARHGNFPKAVEGLIAPTAKTPTVYPLHAVKQYEKERGLLK